MLHWELQISVLPAVTPVREVAGSFAWEWR